MGILDNRLKELREITEAIVAAVTNANSGIRELCENLERLYNCAKLFKSGKEED